MIPSSVTNVGTSAFRGCIGLASITIPTAVTRIEADAFSGCASLTGVYFEGNAPSAGPDVFGEGNGVPIATVYHLPGKAGWTFTFMGRPTQLWLPQVQTRNARFGVLSNQFGFTVQWASGATVVVEASTNLLDPIWSPLGTVVITNGSSCFGDPHWANDPSRFYRLRFP